MDRVLKAFRPVGTSLDAGPVHRLRVALRRCRSFAVLMEEADPHPEWRELKQLSRRLFRALGALRDIHVLAHWITMLAPAGDAAPAVLLTVLDERARRNRSRARRAIRQFDRRAWKRLARRLEGRSHLVPPDSLAAQCLALERFERISRLHARALRTERPIPWHELRIAVKHFRYAVESLLPGHSTARQKGLRQAQEVLGEIHDLDVLEAFVTQEVAGRAADAARPLRRAMAAARRRCIARYRQSMTGQTSLLEAWQEGLPQGARIDAAVAARLDATALALDPHPHRTARVVELALRIFDTLLVRSGHARARDHKARVILRAAAQLHGVRSPHRHASRQKAARAIVHALPLPPGWKSEDWEAVALVIRYHRGAEPASTHGRFARLPKAQQDLVRRLSGVLRLARATHRCGAITPSRVHAEETPLGVRLRVAGLVDTREHVKRLAAAKHLMETYLRRPLIIEPVGHEASQSGRQLHST